MWRVKSFNDFELDNSSYFTYMTDDDNPSILPTTTSKLIGRGRLSPVFTGVAREADQLVMVVDIRANDWRTAQADLVGALSVKDVCKLVVTDHLGAEWHVYARPINALRNTGERRRNIRVPMLVPDRVWRKLASEIVWNITSSGATQNVTNDGNLDSLPVLTFKPKATKTTGFDFRYWIPIINPSKDRAFFDWGCDLTDGGLNTTGWVADASISNQLNGAVTAGAASINIDTPVGGGLPSHGMGYLNDGTHQSQISWTGMTGTPTSGTLTGVKWGVGGTSQYNYADNVVIKLSYMQANGADLRYYSDGVETDLWVDAPNSASTKLWINATMDAGVKLSISVAINNTDDIAEITFAMTVDNLAALNKLPSTGVFKIGSEGFSYWGFDKLQRKAFVEARAINNTSKGSHSVGDIAYLIQRDGWLYSGNPSLSARTNDDTRKPMLDLTQSSNATRYLTSFWDRDGLRTCALKPAVLAQSYPDYRSSRYYTGNHSDETADPATDAGMRMMSVYYNGRWNFENGKVTWTLYEPAGIASVTSWVYEKYRLGSSWPVTAALQKSKDGILYVQVTSVTTPSASAAWEGPTTATPGSIGSDYYFLQTMLAGTIAAGNVGGAGFEADLETDTLVYTTVSPLQPTIMTRGINSYQLNPTLKNTTTGLYFSLDRTMALNEEIEVDCENRTVTTLADGLRRRSAIYMPDDQDDWLVFLAGLNALEYVEDGVTNLDLTIRYYHMLAV